MRYELNTRAHAYVLRHFGDAGIEQAKEHGYVWGLSKDVPGPYGTALFVAACIQCGMTSEHRIDAIEIHQSKFDVVAHVEQYVLRMISEVCPHIDAATGHQAADADMAKAASMEYRERREMQREDWEKGRF